MSDYIYCGDFVPPPSSHSAYYGSLDHFEPTLYSEAADQRRMKGNLEQIDRTAFEANRHVFTELLSTINLSQLKRLAIAAARARAEWVLAAIEATEKPDCLPLANAKELSERRASFEELREAYEALRRMIDRGYVSYKPEA